jgi:hypothetical protein
VSCCRKKACRKEIKNKDYKIVKAIQMHFLWIGPESPRVYGSSILKPLKTQNSRRKNRKMRLSLHAELVYEKLNSTLRNDTASAFMRLETKILRQYDEMSA